MNMQVSRRGFLVALPGLVTLPLAASAKVSAPSLASASSAEILASAPSVPMWAAGTPGDFNWQPVAAETPQQAYAKWLETSGIPDGSRPVFSEACARRMTEWDGKQPEDIRPADWIDGGLGHCCSRCDGETGHESARVIEGDVVCFECMTYGESLDEDDERGMEELVGLIVNEGAEEARAFLTLHEDFDLIGEEIWARAVAEAAARV